MIAYPRHHVAALAQIATYPAPTTKSTFDLLSLAIISDRQHLTPNLQHSLSSTKEQAHRNQALDHPPPVPRPPYPLLHEERPLRRSTAAYNPYSTSPPILVCATPREVATPLPRPEPATGSYPAPAPLPNSCVLSREGSDPDIQGRGARVALAAAQILVECFPLSKMAGDA